ncbi:MAG: tRNA 2-thiouridine(34) synthase MnmA [Planctomycetes bacterium]|jgi:tRNA-specific 2-thiouridylase|nr:tRNA 2-thiouridine(34) synthase MnmA [Planctomycetota bacterium]
MKANIQKRGVRTVCAMSGGVDSSVAAYLLREQEREVVGLFMRNGVRVPESEAGKKSCCSTADARDARMVAAYLGISFQAVDLGQEFKSIITYFLAEYSAGRTPNPCAVCNRDLKFDRLISFARELGAETVATGHYAQIEKIDGRVHVLRGVDRSKDQSYQLFCVSEENLRFAELPIGAMEKIKVRALAKEAGLKTAQKPDSQEICFVPSNDYRKLLEEHAVALHPGPLVDTAGRVLGSHPGTEHFTIGQRRGLGVAGGVPLYVVDIVPATGTVVIGGVEECQSLWLELETVNLIGFDPPADRTFRAQVQVRYHHTAAAATITIGESGERTRVEFDEPQNAVAAGQGAAFYRGERLLGGGWIARAERPRGSGTPEVGAQPAPSSPVSSG